MTRAANKSEIAAAYDRWAETYDSDPNRTRELAAQVLRKVDLTFEDRKVIEVGCGTGRNTDWLATRAAHVTALDFSEAMLRRAREHLQASRVRFIQHDIRQSWPLEDACADFVIAVLILEHVEILELFFAEAARVLGVGGELFICELHSRRQLRGGQAQFTDTQTVERELVPAFLHSVSDYVNAGLLAGFKLQRLDEWRDDDTAVTSIPRLLSLVFMKSRR